MSKKIIFLFVFAISSLSLKAFSAKNFKNAAAGIFHVVGSAAILSRSECLPTAATQKVWGKKVKQDDFLISLLKLFGWNFLVRFGLGSYQNPLVSKKE